MGRPLDEDREVGRNHDQLHDRLHLLGRVPGRGKFVPGAQENTSCVVAQRSGGHLQIEKVDQRLGPIGERNLLAEIQQHLLRTTRGIAASDGQIVKVSPWGRRRLAYPISGQREGSYFIVVFEAPSPAIDELERSLNITEEIMRHLVTRIERPTGARRARPGEEGAEDEPGAEVEDVFDDDYEDDVVGEVIDESESEAAPRAID